MEAAPRADREKRIDAEGWTGRVHPGAPFAIVVLSGVWAWWAIDQGAYFGRVFFPGLILLCGVLMMLLQAAPWVARLSLSSPARIALVALVALAAWTLASGLWSPSPDIAISDAQRVLGYALAFGLGIWLCNLLGERMELALTPVVIAAGAVAIVTAVTMVTTDNAPHVLAVDGTLEYPLQYRNANAAYFAIAFWPALTLAAARTLQWWVRALAATVATTSLALALLSQSRGSYIGIAVALVAYLAVSRNRFRAAAWLTVCALPALLAVPAANDLYAAAKSGNQHHLVESLHSAGHRVVIVVALALLFSLLALRAEPRMPAVRKPSWATPRAGRLALVAGLVALLVSFIAAVGNPADWIGHKFDQFEAGEPDFSKSSNRFTLNAGSNRSDVWRVALDAGKDNPVLGDGAGGFQYRYTHDRHEASQIARDAHSFELEYFSELGIPGLLLVLAAVGATLAGMLRSRKLGPRAATVVAGAVAAGAYWASHTSIDWFWPYPAVTAPVFALAGAACAPAMRTLGERSPHGGNRLAIGICALALAISIVPLFLSDRYVDASYASFRTDPAAAYGDLDRAAQLNPLSDQPLLARGAIANRLGDRAAAIDAFRDAVRKRPEEWAGHFFLAQLYAPADTARAKAELARVRELNPLSDRIQSLVDDIARGGRQSARP